MVERSLLTPAQKLEIALELFESGVAMMRETLKRQHPAESDAQIEERLRQWVRHRPGGRGRRLRRQKDRPGHEIPVTPLGRALLRISGELAESKTPFALVGGLAVSARTEPRFTRDADIAVVVSSDEEAEVLVYSLKGAGYSIDALVEQEAVGRLATVRLSPSGADFTGDTFTSWMRLGAGAGYRLVAGASGLESRFRGPTASISLQFGKFY